MPAGEDEDSLMLCDGAHGGWIEVARHALKAHVVLFLRTFPMHCRTWPSSAA